MELKGIKNESHVSTSDSRVQLQTVIMKQPRATTALEGEEI